METLDQVIKHLLGSTETLAKMGAIAAWVFFTLVLLAERFWTQRAQTKAAENSLNARIKEAEAVSLTANAIEKMSAQTANSIEKLSDQIKELRFKIKCGGPDA